MITLDGGQHTAPAVDQGLRDCAEARRLAQRNDEQFGFAAGKEARRELKRRVRIGDVKYARSLTCSRTLIVLDYAGHELAFIYSNRAKEILRFLSLDGPECEDWRRSREIATALFPREKLREEVEELPGRE